MKLTGLLLLVVLAARGVPAQTVRSNQFTSGCSEEDAKAILPPTHPAYSYAIDLARTLTEKGFTVKCWGESTMVGFFRGTIGGVVYETDRGNIGALFLPKGRVFHIKVIERRENGLYLYSFSGSPKARSPLPAESAGRPCYFVQHSNVLFPMLTSQQLATDLDVAFNSH
jgi:hypothetical protein